ncbi:hypothetical protein [Halocatena halophila]|uniref:hypothetical protein n=1 Tax=Halocatena halophila TaxID=2814576 RepID=UPI002ED53B47
MSVSGLCALCSRPEIVDGCNRCGRLVCEDHYDRDSGWCTDCRETITPGELDEKDTYQL